MGIERCRLLGWVAANAQPCGGGRSVLWQPFGLDFDDRTRCCGHPYHIRRRAQFRLYRSCVLLHKEQAAGFQGRALRPANRHLQVGDLCEAEGQVGPGQLRPGRGRTCLSRKNDQFALRNLQAFNVSSRQRVIGVNVSQHKLETVAGCAVIHAAHFAQMCLSGIDGCNINVDGFQTRDVQPALCSQADQSWQE